MRFIKNVQSVPPRKYQLLHVIDFKRSPIKNGFQAIKNVYSVIKKKCSNNDNRLFFEKCHDDSNILVFALAKKKIKRYAFFFFLSFECRHVGITLAYNITKH